MGYGDDIMATGLARSPASRGRRAAFGDGRRIVWGPWSEEVFRHNPHVARPGEERAADIEWVDHYKGHRLYNRLNERGSHWEWNLKFRAIPGQMFFSRGEEERAESAGKGFILVEPNVPWHKSVAPNKDWGFQNYQEVAHRLLSAGHDVVQFSYGRDRLLGVRVVQTPDFRHALAVLSRARVAVLPEGGLHHGAAAVGTRAVVLFGGFIPPSVTGYDSHANLTGGAEACGSLQPCLHCRRAMMSITVEDVMSALHKINQDEIRESA